MVLLDTMEKGGTAWVAPASLRASRLNSYTMGRPTSLLACSQHTRTARHAANILRVTDISLEYIRGAAKRIPVDVATACLC